MTTQELTNAANFANLSLRDAVSLDMWGGATFDVAMRFLHECPWERLETLREKVPGVLFQMLLYGDNTVGYTNYSNKLVHKFCKQASKSDVDVFHLFGSINYIENLNLNFDAAGSASMFMEGTLSYTGDASDPNKDKSDLSYYIKLIRDLSDMGFHSLAAKDMVGLLNPRAATMLVSTLSEEIPDMPPQIHTHEITGGQYTNVLFQSKHIFPYTEYQADRY